MALDHGHRGSTLLAHITGNKLACNFMILLNDIWGVWKYSYCNCDCKCFEWWDYHAFTQRNLKSKMVCKSQWVEFVPPLCYKLVKIWNSISKEINIVNNILRIPTQSRSTNRSVIVPQLYISTRGSGKTELDPPYFISPSLIAFISSFLIKTKYAT